MKLPPALADHRDSATIALGAALAACAGGLALAGGGAWAALPALIAAPLLAHRAIRRDRAQGDVAITGHRAQPIHPGTGLATREPLFAAIEEAAHSDPEPRLLGTIRLADHDRIAAFDPAAAGRVLALFAARLAAALPASVLLAQVDRDCFALWFAPGSPAQAQAAQFASILFVASQELDDVGTILTPSIEAGSAIWPDDGPAPPALLAQAIAALSATVAGEGGGLVPGRAEDRAAARERFLMEQDLAQAIAGDQLTMSFQPVVDLAEGRLVGAEALLRWDHPVLGAVSPARFIPVVEAIGLGERYGLWVLNAACREARKWRDAGHDGLKIAVNLSAKQLLDHDLATKIARTLDRHGLPPAALELELTETAAMADAGRTLRLFAHLRAQGISLAIDDFGSGYSSLSYLKNLPFDKLKIDREFVTGVDARADSRAICSALIALGKGLGLRVLAEGVETEAEVAALRGLGCSLFQGYHFARPLSGEAFAALLDDADFNARLGSPARAHLTSLQDRMSA